MGERTLTSSFDPAPARDVGNGAAVADQVARRRLGQMGVHDAVQAARLVLVAVDAVLDLFRGVAFMSVSVRLSGVCSTRQLGRGRLHTEEVVRLALHGAETAHLPHYLHHRRQQFISTKARVATHPAVDIVVLPGAPGVRDLVVRIITVGEVLQDGAALEDVDRLAVLKFVLHGEVNIVLAEGQA